MLLEKADPDVGCTAEGFFAIQASVFRFQVSAPLFILLTPET
jgi:hypothetical protein